MKRYIAAVALAAGLSLTGCSDYLDKEPDFLSPENFYQTSDQMESALNGVYNRLIDPNGRMYSKALFSYFAISDELSTKASPSTTSASCSLTPAIST